MVLHKALSYHWLPPSTVDVGSPKKMERRGLLLIVFANGCGGIRLSRAEGDVEVGWL